MSSWAFLSSFSLIFGLIIANIAGTKSIVRIKANKAALAVAIPKVLIGMISEIPKEAKPTAVVTEVWQ